MMKKKMNPAEVRVKQIGHWWIVNNSNEAYSLNRVVDKMGEEAEEKESICW